MITIINDVIPGRVPGDQPRPFMTHPVLTEQDVVHLQIMATIDNLAAQLPKTLSQNIHKSVESHMRDVSKKLGGDWEVTLHEPAAELSHAT